MVDGVIGPVDQWKVEVASKDDVSGIAGVLDFVDGRVKLVKCLLRGPWGAVECSNNEWL